MTEPKIAGFTPLAVKTGKALELSMQRLVLTGRILPVGARLLVRHTFASTEEQPVEAVYCFALPRDAALRRFQITGEGFSVRSQLKPAEEAAKTYEEALAKGHLGALAREYGDGLINLAVGNLRKGDAVTVWLEILAGVELSDDGVRFRFPFTLAPSYHARARSSVVDGGGEIELPEDEFGDLILPTFKQQAQGLHEVGFDLAVDMAAPIAEVASPSHALRVRGGGQESRVSLAPAADVPDRDLVLDIKVNRDGARALAARGGDNKCHFAITVPSSLFGEPAKAPRTAVFVLDRSGSMSGTPINQARKALAACFAALAAEDQFGIVAFDDQIEVFRRELLNATIENRTEAQKFLDSIGPRGGTQLAAGVKAAEGLLKASGGDVVVLTDGQVFGTEDILAIARATGLRLHTLGIGSASQDRFLALLSRETGGASRFVTPRERVDLAALDLFASVSRPVAQNLTADASRLAGARIEPELPKQVFPGFPLLIFGECDANSEGAIGLTWEPSGKTEVPVKAGAGPLGSTLRLLRGSRLITDLEARLPQDRRGQKRYMQQVEELSRAYGLASRAMALVAVVERPADRPGLPPQTRVVPVGLPQDMEFGGVFGAPPATASTIARPHFAQAASLNMSAALPVAEALAKPLQTLFKRTSEVEPALPALPEDHTVDLATLLAPDGGMPGSDAGERILNSLLALLALTAEDQQTASRPFRSHRDRLIEFLQKNLPGPLSQEQIDAARRVLETARSATTLDARWSALAIDAVLKRRVKPKRAWEQLLAGFPQGSVR
jgi:Ca-activated chloride channel family protein